MIQQALDKFDEKLDDKKLKVILHSNISKCYLDTAMYEDCMEHCNKALEIDPDFKKAAYRRAMTWCFLQDYDKSI